MRQADAEGLSQSKDNDDCKQMDPGSILGQTRTLAKTLMDPTRVWCLAKNKVIIFVS
jgi:hypothetical protein